MNEDLKKLCNEVLIAPSAFEITQTRIAKACLIILEVFDLFDVRADSEHTHSEINKRLLKAAAIARGEE